MKPVTCATIAAMSTITFMKRLESRELRDNSPSIAGIMHMQFVIIAPFTTSSSGSIMNSSSPIPIVCNDSATNTWKVTTYGCYFNCCKINKNETNGFKCDTCFLFYILGHIKYFFLIDCTRWNVIELLLIINNYLLLHLNNGIERISARYVM